jgi:hypothetical protein
MALFRYQREVVGFHGCDESVARRVLLSGKRLRKSENEFDWLGRGIYFWEMGPQRAVEWARKSRKVKRPAAIGARINLGNCFDLLDTEHTRLLSSLFPLYRQTCEDAGIPVPVNRAAKGEADGDKLIRDLDCGMINWSLDFLSREEHQFYHTVRCAFSEGAPVFEGSKIFTESHIQVAVRDPRVILGYFRPAD